MDRGEFARGARGGSFRGGSSWGFTRGRGRWPVSTMLPHAGASRSSGARLQTRAPPRPVRRAPSEKNRTSPKPHFDWYPPSGVCLGARKRRGVSGAGTHVIDVRDDGHVADVVLLVHLATELIDGELRWAGRERTGGQRLGLERRPEASKAEKWCEVTGPGSARPRVTRRACVGFGGKEAWDAVTERTFGMVALVVCLSGVFAACASHSKRAAVAPIEPLIPCSFLRNQNQGYSKC